MVAYNEVNNRSKQYLLKIQKYLSEEGFIIWEKLLEREIFSH